MVAPPWCLQGGLEPLEVGAVAGQETGLVSVVVGPPAQDQQPVSSDELSRHPPVTAHLEGGDLAG